MDILLFILRVGEHLLVGIQLVDQTKHSSGRRRVVGYTGVGGEGDLLEFMTNTFFEFRLLLNILSGVVRESGKRLDYGI